LFPRHDGKEYEVVLPDDVEPGERVKVTLEKEAAEQQNCGQNHQIWVFFGRRKGHFFSGS